MKKIASLLMVVMVVLTGCSCGGVKNSLAEQLGSIDQIEFVTFNQLMQFSAEHYPEDCMDDIEEMMYIFSQVSSDSEQFEEYLSEGFNVLYSANIVIQYKSGEKAMIEWETGTGVLTYNDVEYYIDIELAQTLYDIFIKYNPPYGDVIF